MGSPVELVSTERAVVYGRIGTCNQEFGSLASWLVDVVNILTGHFDNAGGSMFPRATAWSVTVQPIPGLEDGAPEFGRFRTRVRGAKEVLGQVPVSCLAEEIATPGEGQIKALITVAGNPVLSTPAGHTLDEVLPQLDAMISVDLWLNETTRHADVILPGLSPLEQPHHDDLILNFAVNSIANYSAPVFEPEEPDRPREWEILVRLTGLCTGMPAEDVDVAAIDDGFFDYMAFTQGLDGAELRKNYASTDLTGGPERILDLTLRTGPFGDRYGENPDGLTLEKLKAEPNGINFGPMVPRVPEVLGTADKKIRLAPQYLLDDLPRLAARLDRAPDELVLVSRRHLRSNNSWLHNVGPLMKGKDRCTLLMHTDDAVKHGVVTGDVVAVTSAGGRIEVPVEVTDGDHAGRGVDAARLGSRQAGHPHVGRQRFPRREHQRAVPAELHRRAVGQRGAQRHPGDGHRNDDLKVSRRGQERTFKDRHERRRDRRVHRAQPHRDDGDGAPRRTAASGGDVVRRARR